jgi:hypothetical protein
LRRPLLLSFDHVVLEGEGGGGDARRHAVLGEDVLEMPRDRVSLITSSAAIYLLCSSRATSGAPRCRGLIEP